MSASVRGIVRWGRSWVRALMREEPRAVLTSTLRTRAEQARLYARWLAGRGRRAARPGTSLHELGLAFDVSAPHVALLRLGALWRSVGGGWLLSHPIHFELTEQLRERGPP